ncbi:MAG: hypothetical protein K0U84_24765 [Actinomycetia bacterium]|nr:hypothetical protein [Actinomycetes bacterium]
MGHAAESVANLLLNGWASAGAAVPAFSLAATNCLLPAVLVVAAFAFVFSM